jgi:hypothetical protein
MMKASRRVVPSAATSLARGEPASRGERGLPSVAAGVALAFAAQSEWWAEPGRATGRYAAAAGAAAAVEVTGFCDAVRGGASARGVRPDVVREACVE